MEAVFVLPLVGVALILAALPAIRLLHMGIDGQVEMGQVVIGLFLYLVLIVSVAAGPGPLKVAALVLIFLSAVVLPVAGRVAAERDMKRIDDDRLRAYTAALERNPMDPVARIALAEELYRRGDVQQAIEHMEWTLQQYPRLAVQHQTTLDTWRREVATGGQPEFIICHICHAENPAEATFCGQCGAPFTTAVGMWQRIQMEGGPKAILRGWIIGVPVVMLGLFVLLELPAIVAAPIIIAMLIVGAWLFLRWVGG